MKSCSHWQLVSGSMAAIAALLCLLGHTALGDIVISEIMYNPDGSDRDNTAGFNREWVEVYNSGSQAVNLGGWQFADLYDNDYASLVPENTILQPGSALVLVGDAATFDAQWGTGLPRVELSNFPSLSNTPTNGNERLAFYNPVTNQGDTVTYDDTNGWPTDSPDGSSIMLQPEYLHPAHNNAGGAWLPSMWGVYGAEYRTSPEGTQDRASPGFVDRVPQTAFEPSPDAAWSMVVMPDSQNYVKNSADVHILREMNEWIRDQRDAFNIQLVMHEGDIVNNNNTSTPTSGNQTGDQQWQNAKAAMSVLDGVVPYVFSPGNHDYGTTSAQTRETQFNDYFRETDNPLVDPAQGGILVDTLIPGQLDSAYFEFTAPDGREMLILTLEWGPRQYVVNAANRVMSDPKYADHTAIMMTHAYMYHDETRYDWSRNQDSDPNNNQGGNPYSYGTANDTNDGQDLWEELVSQHDQFEMVLSGHVGGDGVGYQVDPGSDGQLVHQMLFNSQFETNAGNGWIRMVEFLDDGKTVRIRTYSPLHDLQKTDSANSFTFEITPLPTILSGDFNDDGIVDLADYTLWRDSLGAPAGTLLNDRSGEVIGTAQYQLWKDNFGRTSADHVQSGATQVPEPASLVWYVVLISATVAGRFARRGDH
ncbi:lamin tail domain-containing protein [Aeoliella mucimassa]|uniref:lamin tail domain-containing protein n=1 Tax=Aeoliella mucimassa TaxID=2527972 RepID=UPI0018D3A12F|nr:lamin tail domain-containing protein [Aeoliella mucimassa]